MSGDNGATSEKDELEAAEQVGEEAVDVTKGLFKAAADLISKTGVVLLIIIIVGIVLLVIRDLIYQVRSAVARWVGQSSADWHRRHRRGPPPNLS